MKKHLLFLTTVLAVTTVSALQTGCTGVYAVGPAPAPAYYYRSPAYVSTWGGTGYYRGAVYRGGYYNNNYYNNNYWRRNSSGQVNGWRGGSVSWNNGSGNWHGPRGGSGSWHH